jgi:nitrogen-specific signal transduction histidine kinase
MPSHDRLLAALDHVYVGVLLLEADLTVSFANRAQFDWIRRLGVDRHRSEVIGSHAAQAYPLFSQEEWDGISVRVVTGGESIRWSKLPCPRVSPTSYVAVDFSPLGGQDGERPGILCVTEDVTHGVAVDRELIKKERLALVGQTGVALVHEVSNPLAAILGSVEALLYSQTLGPDAAKRIETIKLNALRIAEITRKLRDLEDLQLTEYLQGGPVYVTAEPRSS